VVVGLVPLAVWAAGCRFTLADQSNWEARRGFYLTLEDAEPCHLANLKLTLGVAGAGAWRFAVETPAWQPGREYTVTAVLAGGRHELYLDGKLLRRIEGEFAPWVPEGVPRLLAGANPEWAGREADFLAAQTGLALATSGGRQAELAFPPPRPVPFLLLAPEALRSVAWTAPARETWTIRARFRLDARPDLAAYVPYVDRWGQSAHARWPGKIASDRDLGEAAARETVRLAEWGVPRGFDRYGGLLGTGWNVGPGFYRVKQRDGRWWLITPAGNPCFYLALDTAPALVWDRTPVTGRLPGFFAELPPRDGPWQDVWGRDSWGGAERGNEDLSFGAANLIRKFGSAWRQAAADLTVRRVQAWGFSGLGKWASDGGRLPSIPVLSRRGVPNAVRHPDIFDAAIRERFRAEIARQVMPRSQDPLVVGWSLGSELEEIVTGEEIEALLKLVGTPSYRALWDEALAGIYHGDRAALDAAWGGGTAAPHPPAADIERLRRFYARAYYRFIYETVKSIDSNHLYFGFWIVPGGWQNEEDWRLIAPWCDVIGFDDYSEHFAAPSLAALMRETGKPVFAGEFSFPPAYGNARGYRSYTVSAETEAESGERYAAWIAEAQANPFCVGVGWFQYRDQPVSGRGPGHGPALTYGEDFAFGLVDVGDRPKWDLVERIRAVNLRTARERWRARPTAPR
jgi:hypothetical protein